MTTSRQRKIIIWTVIVFVLLAILIVVLDWKDVKQIIGTARWQFTLLALLAIFISYFCLSFGYLIVCRVFGITTGWWHLFEIGLVSSTLNNLLGFAGAAGHSLRVQLRGRGVAAGNVMAASIFHSYLNIVMLLLMLALGVIVLLLSHIVYGGGAIGVALIATFLTVSLIISTAIIFIPWLKTKVLSFVARVWHFFTHRDIKPFLTDFNDGLIRGLSTLKGRPWELTLLLVLMAGEWIFQAVAMWFCFGALGTAPGLGVLLSGFGIGLSAGNLSWVPGGLGVQEASMAGVYALLGLDFAQAALVAILFRVVYDFIPFFLTLPFYERLIRKA